MQLQASECIALVLIAVASWGLWASFSRFDPNIPVYAGSVGKWEWSWGNARQRYMSGARTILFEGLKAVSGLPSRQFRG
jgi:hypothetical protein